MVAFVFETNKSLGALLPAPFSCGAMFDASSLNGLLCQISSLYRSKRYGPLYSLKFVNAGPALPHKHAPPHVVYCAEFGRSRSNSVRVSKGSQENWERWGWRTLLVP